MASKLRLKLGPIEVEYEGEEKFLKDELPNLLRTVVELQKSARGLQSEDDSSTIGDADNGGAEKQTDTKIQLSTGSIASKLGCKSGPDLLFAACAHLALVKGMASYPRKDVLKEAKTATAFYNKSVLANMTAHLNSLVKADKLNETSAGVFALQAKALADIKAKLGLSH